MDQPTSRNALGLLPLHRNLLPRVGVMMPSVL